MKKVSTPIYLLPEMKEAASTLAQQRGLSLSAMVSMLVAGEVNEAKQSGEIEA